MFKNNDGFTLIEMLVVLLIISVLIILIVPNIGKRSADIHDQGCDALVKVVQAQVDLYILEEGEIPGNLGDLLDDYITEDQLSCTSGDLDYENGTVSGPSE